MKTVSLSYFAINGARHDFQTTLRNRNLHLQLFSRLRAHPPRCLIDPVASELPLYLDLLQSLDLQLVYTLETHVHADHITGSGLLREKVGSKSVVHRDAGAMCADLLVTDGVPLQVGDLQLQVRHTPGHTNGCVSYVMADRVFTGDAC